MASTLPTILDLEQIFREKEFSWNPHLNLVGIRSGFTKPDIFDDHLLAVWRQPAMPAKLSILEQQRWLNDFLIAGENGLTLKPDGQGGRQTRFALNAAQRLIGSWRQASWTITTDPGLYYLQHPVTTLGCAVLVPGQYPGCWTLGLHQGKTDHPALIQHGGPVRVYRDNNKNSKPEASKDIISGYFGINCHRSSLTQDLAQVGKWSAGCQVFQNAGQHKQLLNLCRQLSPVLGGRFSYTLLEA